MFDKVLNRVFIVRSQGFTLTINLLCLIFTYVFFLDYMNFKIGINK